MLGKDTKILIGLLFLFGLLYYWNQREDFTVPNEGGLTMGASTPNDMNTDIYPGETLSDQSNRGIKVRKPIEADDEDLRTSVRTAKTEIDEWDDYFRDTNSVIGRSQISRENDRYHPSVEDDGSLAPYEREPIYKRNKIKRHKEPSGSFDPDMYDPMNLLPQEKHDDWFEVIDEPVSLKNRHLVSLQQPLGINTIGQSLKNACLDLRGNPPNPKMSLSPWLNSTIEPDYNIKPLC
jgi:hypothetical protein